MGRIRIKLKHSVATPEGLIAKINVGGQEYDVNLDKVPYFASMAHFQSLAGQLKDDALPTHGAIPFFGAINQGLNDGGFGVCFRQLPLDLEDYRALCENLHFLCIDVLGGRSLEDVFFTFLAWQENDTPESSKALRRYCWDNAFRLIYMLLMLDYDTEVQAFTQEDALNTVEHVLKHRHRFNISVRRMVRLAFEDRFPPDALTLGRLDRWRPENIEEIAETYITYTFPTSHVDTMEGAVTDGDDDHNDEDKTA